MKPKAKWEHENKTDCLLTKKNLKSPRTTEKPRIVFEADLWKMLKNSTPWVGLEWIEFFSFLQHFSAFWKLMNAHFSKNSCYSRYSVINEWPHCGSQVQHSLRLSGQNHLWLSPAQLWICQDRSLITWASKPSCAVLVSEVQISLSSFLLVVCSGGRNLSTRVSFREEEK